MFGLYSLLVTIIDFGHVEWQFFVAHAAESTDGDEATAQPLPPAAEETAPAVGDGRAPAAGRTVVRLVPRRSGRDERGSPLRHGTFRREGDVWTIVFEDRLLRARAAVGLVYIAHLLEHPGTAFHVAELSALVHGVPDGVDSRLPDGPLRGISATPVHASIGAQQDYRRRLVDLYAELAEATASTIADGSSGSPARSKRSPPSCRTQSASAGGSGATPPPSSACGSRSRRRSAMPSSACARDAGLGEHLDAAIRTGTFCSYAPTSRDTVSWTT